MSRNGHEKFNNSALTTLTNPKRKRATKHKRGMEEGRSRGRGKGVKQQWHSVPAVARVAVVAT